MTVTLDLSPRLIRQIEADAKAQNRPVDAVVGDAVAARYDEAETESGYIVDPADAPPRTQAEIESDARAVMEAFHDFDAGDRGKSPAQSFALVAARLGLKDTTL